MQCKSSLLSVGRSQLLLLQCRERWWNSGCAGSWTTDGFVYTLNLLIVHVTTGFRPVEGLKIPLVCFDESSWELMELVFLAMVINTIIRFTMVASEYAGSMASRSARSSAISRCSGMTWSFATLAALAFEWCWILDLVTRNSSLDFEAIMETAMSFVS